MIIIESILQMKKSSEILLRIIFDAHVYIIIVRKRMAEVFSYLGRANICARFIPMCIVL